MTRLGEIIKLGFVSLLLLQLMCLWSCRKQPESTKKPETTHFIGHKASGNSNTIFPNTLESILFAFEKLDGAEIDIQISKDTTLWVWHDDLMINCQNDTQNIMNLYDYEIEQISGCKYNWQLTRLEQVFDYLSDFPESKFLSLDLKTPVNQKISDFEAKIELGELVVDRITKFYQDYRPGITLGIESSIGEILIYQRTQNTAIETYLLGFSDLRGKIDYTTKSGITGVSFRFSENEPTLNDMEELWRNGLKLQLWTPNSEADIERARLLEPDYIQTDNVDYVIENFKN